MAEIHEGLVEDLGPNGESPVRQGVPPPAQALRDNTPSPQTPSEWLHAQQRELQEARLALDGGAPSLFDRVSQNVTMAAATLDGLPPPTTPKER
jgi:hypothetical protein